MQHKFTPTTHLKRAVLTLLALIMACATAWAGTVTVNIIGSGTVNVTYNGTTTEENINSGWNMTLSGSLTLIMIPAQGYTLQELQMVTNLGSSTESTIENNGVYTYAIENVSFYDITYTVVFSIPGVTTYTLTGDGMTFSVEGQTVTSAEEGQRVDITLPSPGNHSYWVVTSSDVAIQKDDANHFHFTMPAKSVIVNAQQYYQTACYVNDESTHGHVMVNGNNAGTENHYADETITLTPVADAGYEYLPGTLTATNINTNESINLTDNGDGTWSFTMPNSQVSVSATFSFDPAHITMSGNEYTIHTATGWNVFCDLLEGGESFSGKTVKLGANISITQSAGSAGHEFMGTFDGDGKTLTVDITETTTQGTAPFREIKGATIQNLVVTGSVEGTIHAAGLVGYARGADANTVNTITNCKVATNVTVTTPNSAGNYHCGGVVGHALQCTLNMSNTVYCGDITNSGNYVGGLQGWSDGNTINFSHCLFVGSYSGTASFHPVAVGYNNSATTANVSHVYYTVTPTLTNSNFIAADGTKTISRATAPATIGDQTQSLNFMSTTLYQNGICYNNLYYATIGLPSGGTDIYLIDNADDWLYFCEMLNDNDTWNRFSGKTVKLGADITITTMAGGQPFTGTFDGDGHTLTLDYGTADAPVNAQFVAPFVETTAHDNYQPAFRNLTIGGHIYANHTPATDHDHAGGLIGHLYGDVTIEHCTSNVEITAPGGAGGFVGLCEHTAMFTDCKSTAVIHSEGGNNSGFVGWSRASGHAISFEGCVFNGKLLQQNGNGSQNGGFIGWTGSNKTVTFTNCFYIPATLAEGEVMASSGSATFARGWNATTTATNSYYTEPLGTAQGTQAYSISGGNYVTVENAGTVSNNYTTSGLTFYNAGLKYGDVLYAAASDEVSLTLGNTVPEGYFLGYSASPTGATLSGSGNPYTLTMPDADVVITANTNFPSVSYIDENGETQQCTDYLWLTGTETTLGAEGQETWCVVHSTLDYSQSIQLLGNTHIILCDGAAMNIGTSDSPVSGSSFQEQVGFYGGDITYNLSLYAQSGNTGALTIYSQSCSFFVKDLTIAGGNVNATSLSDVPVIFCDNLTVCRSSLEVHANYYAAIQANNDVTLSNVTANLNSSNAVGLICSNFAVDHSQLTVTARYQAIQASNVITLSNVTANINSSNGSGLVCSNFAVDHSQLTVTALYQAIQASNVITLGCTAATDFIKATCTSSLTDSYYGTVKIADGQTLYAGANAYTGTLTDAQRQAIGGQKLTNVAPPTYDYIGLDGTGATHTAVVIDADNMPTSLLGWYIVQGTVNYTNTINLAGDTHIILADNAVMNVTVGGYHGIRNTSGNNYSLFVYGQTGQSGELNVTSNDCACYIYGGDITIAGGKVTASAPTGIFAQYNNNGGNVTIKNATVTATASYYAIRSTNGDITIDSSNVTATSTGSYGIYAEYGNITIASGTVTASGKFSIYTPNGSVTINGGQVTTTGNFGIYTVNGSVTINGGQVTATGNIYGIYAQNPSDNITLGWTNPTDCIYVNKYYADGTLSIAEGKAFIDEAGQTYSDTIAMVSGAYSINGKTLYPYNENAVPYLDENGQQRYCVAYTTLTGTETELGTAGQETWYVVDSDVSCTDLTINGDIHLILVDGKTMNLNHEQGFVTLWGQANLTIYGQTNGTGTLSSLGLISTMNITVNGGIVNVKGDGFFKEENFLPAIWCEGMVINGGTVYAQGDMGIVVASMGAKSDDMTTYNFTLNGGQVTAIGMSTDMGIIATGNITLGWTNPTDYIYANSYYAADTLSIASGKTFIDDDGNPYSGIIAQVAGAYAIDGKTLYPYSADFVYKSVAGYGDSDGGYCLIASPNVDNTDPATINGMILTGDDAADYDLYRFDPTNEGSEWVNYKADTFNLINGHGYLYAFKNTKTLVFTGPFITDTESVAVGLAYDATDDHKCWNLVGNPFPCEATINKPYYVLNADGTTINPTAIVGGTIPACTAVFVKGESSDDRVVFSKVSAPASSAPIGAIDGLFSVSADKQVYFSQGNLQYQPSTTTWRFAPNQYDLLITPEDLNLYHSAVGNYADVTSLYTENYTDWIDFFGWGTSGWNSGANAYMPYDPSYTADDFYPGGDYNNDLTGTCANADWAWYNPISNGGNAANQWRTLTHDEWAYLFSGRDGATSKYGHGSVNGVNGMIILPDNWTLPDGCSFTPGNSDWTNSYTTTEWAAMEAAGAVFLPAAGQRSFGTFVNNVGNLGRYWSSTHRNNTAAYDVWFHSDFISELDTQAYYSNRSMGYSVRPVQDAQ